MIATKIAAPSNADGMPVSVPIGANDQDIAAFISPMRGLRTTEATRLVGVAFDGTVVDSNFWATTTGSGGAISQALGQLVLSTTGTNSTATLASQRKGRYMSSNSNHVRCVIRVPTVNVTGNTRRWGAFDSTDGLFFEISGSTFSVGIRRGGSTTTVNSGNFNGTNGSTYTLDTNVHTYEIHYTNSSAWFYIDNELIHTYRASAQTLCGTLSLKIGLENSNSASTTTAATLECRVATIVRLGKETGRPRTYYVASAGTNVLKRSPGTLRRVIVGTRGTGGATVTFYDAVNAGGQPLFVLDGVNSLGTIELDVDFFEGLSMVTASGIGSITVLYD